MGFWYLNAPLAQGKVAAGGHRRKIERKKEDYGRTQAKFPDSEERCHHRRREKEQRGRRIA